MPRFLGLGRATGTINLSSYTVIKASCSGTSAASTLSATASFSAGQRLFICQMRGTGVGNYEDNAVLSYTSGTITLLYPLQNTYTDSGASQAQVVVVPDAASYSGTLTVPAWDGDVGGLVVLASSSTFSATIDGSAKGFRGGQQINGANTTGVYGYSGEGTVGASAQNANTNANGNGAGSTKNGTVVNHGAGGTGGGNGTAGSGGESFGGENGAAGEAVGDAALSTIFMGGGGSSGCKTNSGTNGLRGGNGGAIIVVYSPSFSGTITSNGENGAGDGSATAHGGGGGGAGGSILIRCATFAPTSLTATAGAGGTVTATSQDGGAGGVGRIRIETCSGTATTSPTASISAGGHSYCSAGVLIY